MAINWYNIGSYCSLGIDWQYSSDGNNVYITPLIYRWDRYDTENTGSKWWESLSPDTVGAGYWSGLGFGTGSGTRQIDSFGMRTYSRGHSAYTVTYRMGWDSSFGTVYDYSFHTLGSGSNSWSITVPAKDSYTVSYNANGGSGAPSAQTKWYNETLTLSSTKPTRTNYTFIGWSTSSNATSATWSAGGAYANNSGATLYAVWLPNPTTCTLSYNANGGSGAPSSQTHVQNTTSKISSAIPTRTNYAFIGWSTSSSATSGTYLPDGQYTNNSFTKGSTITLYAVWAKMPSPMHLYVPTGSTVKALYVNVTNSYKGLYYNA